MDGYVADEVGLLSNPDELDISLKSPMEGRSGLMI